MKSAERIIFAADVGSLEELRGYLTKFKGEIGAVKLGMELMSHSLLTGEPVFQVVLTESDLKIMLDLKYGDIPATVAGAAKEVAKYGQGRILGFTVHCSAGRKALEQAVLAVKDNFPPELGTHPMVIGVTLLTSLDQTDLDELGITGSPKETVLRWVKIAAEAGIPAIVCSPQETKDVLALDPNFTVINPGIRFAGSDLGTQKRVTTPQEAFKNGAAYVVMGSDLRKGDPLVNSRKAVAEAEQGLKEKLDLALFNISSIKFGTFKLKLHEKDPDAPLSPIYLNLRSLPAIVYTMMADALHDLAEKEKLNFDYVVGIPKAGEPIGEAFAKAVNKPLLRMEKIEGESGRKISSKILDAFEPGKKVVLIDDLVTQADTKREAYNGLLANGLEVEAILVIYDREQGGCEQLNQEGKRIFAARKLSESLELYVKTEKITTDKRDEVLAYISANR